jgi:hypothetical protein
MAKINDKTWREQTIEDVGQGNVLTIYFDDTNPNYVLLANPCESPLFVSTSPRVANDNADMVIPPNGRQLFSQAHGVKELYIRCYDAILHKVPVKSWEGEFDPVTINQTQQTVPQSDQQTLGYVTVNNFPATQQVAGSVGINNFPATQQVGGTVEINNFPTTQQVAGTVEINNFPTTQQVAGTVEINNFPTTQQIEMTKDSDTYNSMKVTAAGDTIVKNVPGKLIGIKSDGVTVAILKDDVNELWKTTGETHFSKAIQCVTNITVNLSAAGECYVLYQ